MRALRIVVNTDLRALADRFQDSCPRGYAELGEDVRQMSLHGPDADEQRLGDLLVRVTLANQLDHVKFSLGEAARSGASAGYWHPDAQPALMACRSRVQRARAALGEGPRGRGEICSGLAVIARRGPGHARVEPRPADVDGQASAVEQLGRLGCRRGRSTRIASAQRVRAGEPGG